MRCPTFTIETELAVTPEDFWRRMSLASVNAELAPLVRMTAPEEWREVAIEQWPTGRTLFNSVILLFGFLPIDVHRFRLEQVYPQRGFLERSSSLVNRVWRHERTIQPGPSGCLVTDVVTVQSRVPLLGGLLLPVFRAVFRNRHRRLRALYGESTP